MTCDIRDNQAGSKDTLAAGACKYNFFHLFGLLSPGDEGAQVGGMCIENVGGVRAVKHGTGKTRKPYMNLQYTPHVLGIMKSIKKAFDPNNILNPGVIIDLDD